MTATASLLVFARAPRPGGTKTRLIPALGAEGAARLHERMLEHAVAVCVEAALGPVTLCCAPDTSHPCFVELSARTGCVLARQSPGDLGERMASALEAALAAGRPALLVGSDCPALGPLDLRQAAAALTGGAAVVLVPALDGGYVLVGLRRPLPAMFRGIDWGSERVLEQTRARLRAAGTRWVELDARADVDTPADLEHLPAGWLPGRERAGARSRR